MAGELQRLACACLLGLESVGLFGVWLACLLESIGK
jgi:hypothetical protein